MRIKLEKLASLAMIPAIIIAEALVALWVITGSSVVEDALTRVLGDSIGGECRAEQVSIAMFGGIEIGELELIADRDLPPLLWARGVRARFSAERLLSGTFAPEEITVDNAAFWFPSESALEADFAAPRSTAFSFDAIPEMTIRVRRGVVEMEGLPHAFDEIDLVLSSDGDGVIVGALSGSLAGGKIRASGSRKPEGTESIYQFRLEGDRIDCSSDLESFFALIGAVDGYRAFSPRGEISFLFESDPVTALPVTGRLRLFAHGAAVTYLGWPVPGTGVYDESFLYSLENLNGVVTANLPGEVIIDAVEGTINEGRLSADGFVRFPPLTKEKRLTFDIRNVDIDEEIIAAIEPHDPTIAEVLKDLNLKGSADILLTLLSATDRGRSEETDAAGLFEASVVLRDISICPVFFPLLIEGVRGQVAVRKGRVTFDAIEGRYGGVVVTGAGMADSERISLDLKARNVAVDAGLIDALRVVSNEAAQMVESIGLSGGRVGLDIEFESLQSPEGGEEPRINMGIHVAASGCTARPGFFPLPVDTLGGDVFVRIDDSALRSIEIENLTAAHEGSRLNLGARLDETGLVDLDISGRNQKVTPQLLAALGEAAPGSAEWVEGLYAEGVVDFEGAWREGALTIDFHPRFSLIASPLLPCPLTDLDGTVRWQHATGRILVESLSVGIGRGRFVFDTGEASFLDSGTSIRLSGSGQGLDLNLSSFQLASGNLQDLFHRLDLKGFANVKDAGAEIVLDSDGVIKSLQGSASVSFDGASMDWPVGITDIFGRIGLDFQLPGAEGGRFELTGEGSYLSFVLEKREFSGVHTNFLIDESGVRISSLDGNLYGGRVLGDKNTFAMSFDPPCPFRGRLRVRGADLNRLLGRAGYAFKDISGKLNYRLRFEGEMENINRMTAEGKMSVEDGHLWRLPVFSALWGPVVNIFGVGKPPAFETGSTDFTLKEGILNLENAVLNSSLMTLQGSGALTVDSANVEVQFSVGPTLPIIGDVIAPLTGLIKQGFFNLRVSGDYDNMQVSYDSILTSPFRSGEVTDTARCPGPQKALQLERF